ncbi:MAG: helix-turn-helix domain-containing protein [Rhodoplanes sp.]
MNKQITAISGVKSQREIAAELGYERPNIISMMKRGETKLPLDKVPALAKALHVDPAHLFRLALEQQMDAFCNRSTSSP